MRYIPGYEGRYAITELGNVYSIVSRKWLKKRLVKRGNGYLQVSLWTDNEEKKFYVHRLVALTYIPNPEDKATVNHKDGNTRNNWYENLEWASHQEQQDHAWDTGLTNNHGENCGTAKLTVDDVSAIVELCKSSTQRAVADMFGINQSQVSRIVNKQRWKERDASHSRARRKACEDVVEQAGGWVC